MVMADRHDAVASKHVRDRVDQLRPSEGGSGCVLVEYQHGEPPECRFFPYVRRQRKLANAAFSAIWRRGARIELASPNAISLPSGASDGKRYPDSYPFGGEFWDACDCAEKR